MYLIILLLPFTSAIIIFLFGRFLGKYGASQISIGNLFISFCLNFYLLIQSFYFNNFITYTLGTWINYTGILNVDWEFQFDSISLIMIFVVTAISLLVHIYSWNYMEGDPFIIRFFGLLSLFTFFMLILVTSTNFIQLFLGWEGIGLCSYFLIGFWYTRIQANKAALKAIIINRIGDIALLIAISISIFLFGTTDFNIIFNLLPIYSLKYFQFYTLKINCLEFLCFWLMIAAVGKSAQFGLHTWLPDAMEGPTPVSALIHAATMVTAGIFLIIRCSFIFEYAPNILMFISCLGALTAIFAASCGLVQNDIKKVIAYSTCSQLGYMFFACGNSNYIGSFFHLASHAFFKALLFLSAGSVIHALSNEQDMRKMGGLSYYTPVTYIAFIIGSLALGGFPFLSGFYSKDFILENSFFLINPLVNILNFSLLIITASFTLIYSLRLLFLVFWSPSNSYKHIFTNVRESSWFLLFPLIILSLGSLLFGYLLKDFFIGFGNNFFIDSIFFPSKQFSLYDIENLLFLKNLPFYFNLLLVFIFVGLLCIMTNWITFQTKNLGYLRILSLSERPALSQFLYRFFIYKWYVDYFIYRTSFYLYKMCYTWLIYLDKGLLEILQPISFTHTINLLSNYYLKFNSKRLEFYFFFILYSLFFILTFYYFF